MKPPMEDTLSQGKKVLSIDEEILNSFPINIQGNLFRTSSVSHEACANAYISVFILFDLSAAINY